MHPLEKRFDAEENAYRHLRKSCESKVVRWEFWNGFHWHWDPAVFKQREDRSEASKRTSKEQAVYAYGYDTNDRIVVIRRGLPGKQIPHLSEEFIRYSNRGLSSTKYSSEQLLEICSATLIDGLVVRVEQVGSTSDWHTIKWDGDRVARIQFGSFGKKPALEWCYDKRGKLIGMYDLPRRLKLPGGVTTVTLGKTIHEHLMQAVPKIVTKCGIKQSVYCLTLAYDGEGNGVVPPSLAIGLDSERQKWTRTKGKAAKEFIWNPAKFRIFETEQTALPTNKKFEQACEWYNQLLEKKGSEKPARDLLNRVAADLAKLNWKSKLNTTEDFIVFAVDYEGADLKKNVKASVAPKLLAKLKAAGWM